MNSLLLSSTGTPCSHCSGHGSNPWSGNWGPENPVAWQKIILTSTLWYRNHSWHVLQMREQRLWKVENLLPPPSLGTGLGNGRVRIGSQACQGSLRPSYNIKGHRHRGSPSESPEGSIRFNTGGCSLGVGWVVSHSHPPRENGVDSLLVSQSGSLECPHSAPVLVPPSNGFGHKSCYQDGGGGRSCDSQSILNFLAIYQKEGCLANENKKRVQVKQTPYAWNNR